MKLADLFPEASVEDLKLYLEGTLVLSNNLDGTKTVFEHGISLVKHIDSENAWICNPIASDRPIGIPLTKWDMLPIHPEVGYYSIHRTCAFLSNRTLRQNRKSVCTNTTCLTNLFRLVEASLVCMVQEKLNRPFPDSLKQSYMLPSNIESIYRILLAPQRYFALQHAIQRIVEEKTFARALSKTFACSMGIRTGHPITLWFNLIPVGYIEHSSRIIVTEPMFFQEVYDQFAPITEVVSTLIQWMPYLDLVILK